MVCLFDSQLISLTRTAWRRPPSNRQRRCTAKQQPGSHAAGISRSSRFPSIGPDTDFRTIDFDLIPEGLLERCTIDLAKGTVGTERLSERCCEFAMVNPRREGLSCRYGWMAVAERETGNDPLQAIKKLDLVNGERKVWSTAPRGLVSEPVLVPRSMPVGSPEPAEDGGLTPLQC
jgi:all-trans-8'-apo-beta-carotenal 15,15'-oxygenase